MTACGFSVVYAVAALCFAATALPHALAAQVNPETMVLFDPVYVDVNNVRDCFVCLRVCVWIDV